MKRRFRMFAVAAVVVLGLASPALSQSPGEPRAMGAPGARTPGPQHSYRVWRGGDASLPDHTVLRPADLRSVPFKLPIVVWANGGCRHSNEEYRYFLTTLASYGVLIVANGAPGNPYEATDLVPLLSPQPEMLLQAIDWVGRQNADRRSPLYRRLDLQRLLVMGQSCGGWEATDASKDPRVTSTIIWNSGANPRHPTGIGELHAPVLFAHGGTFDHVAWDAVASYRLAGVPAVLAAGSEGGHTNWWDDPPAGTPRPTPQQREPLVVAAHWMAFTLYGSRQSRAFFLGDDCGLCGRRGWTVESKNWG